ncbi:MAG: phosphatase PAP2 family protein [Acidimicrobiales bacterium]
MHSLITFVGRYFIFLSVVIAVVFWLGLSTEKKIALGWRVLVGGALAEGLAQIAGHLYYDTRPFVTAHVVPLIAHAPDNGFPSDHALLASFLGFVILLYSRRVGLLLLVVAILIGWARVAAHIHHPIDVVGSFVLAAVSVTIVQVGAHLVTRWHHTSPPKPAA